MTQVSAPQQQPVARLAQGPQGVHGLQNEQANPPAALGTRHSIGQTIGRVALAIISFGLSELVINVFKTCAANQARAEARLPENQPKRNEDPIFKANSEKADRIGEMLIVESSKTKVTGLLGTLGTLDNTVYNTALQKAIKSCKTEVTDAKLGELAEKVGRGTLTANIVRNILVSEPQNAGLSEPRKNILTNGLLASPQGMKLHNVESGEALEPLVATLKDMVKEQATSRAIHSECKQELMAVGLQMFSEMTGLAPGSFKMDTWALEDKLNMIGSDINLKAATPEKPYATANKETVMASWQPRAESFFSGRAKAYTSLASMDIPDALKKDLQQSCLTGQEAIQADTFTKSMDIYTAMATDRTLMALTVPTLSTDEKLNIIEAFATKQSQATLAAFGEDRMLKMGPDDRGLVSSIAYKAIFAKNPELTAELARNPALLTTLSDSMQGRVAQSMGNASDATRAATLRTLGANETLQMILLAVNVAATSVANVAPQNEVIAPQDAVPPVDVPKPEDV